MIIRDQENQFCIVHVEMDVAGIDQKDPNQCYKTAILDRMDINKLVVKALAENQDWQPVCQQIADQSLEKAKELGFNAEQVYNCAVFESADYVFESNFPSNGDYLEWEIGKYIIIYYGSTLLTNKAWVCQANFEQSLNECGALAVAKAKGS